MVDICDGKKQEYICIKLKFYRYKRQTMLVVWLFYVQMNCLCIFIVHVTFTCTATKIIYVLPDNVSDVNCPSPPCATLGQSCWMMDHCLFYQMLNIISYQENIKLITLLVLWGLLTFHWLDLVCLQQNYFVCHSHMWVCSILTMSPLEI